MRICENTGCSNDIPPAIYVEGVRKRLHRKYCLKCSLYRARNTRRLERVPQEITGRECLQCFQWKPAEDFYSRKRQGYVTLMSYCKICWVQRMKRYRQQLKAQAVAYKGGACEECGYDKCIAALDFHHRDPTQKDFTLSRSTKRSFKAIQPELDKCRLLCANCHREVHWRLNQEAESVGGTGQI